MTHVCKACAARGKTWHGDDPRCAFANEEGVFDSNNWNCATVHRLRDLVYEGQRSFPAGIHYQYCDDQKYATVNIDEVTVDGENIGLTLWMTWYKSRGGTDEVWVLDTGRPPRRPTEAEVLAIVDFYDAKH